MLAPISSISSHWLQNPYVSIPGANPDNPDYIVSPGTGFDGVVNITDWNYTGSGVLLQTGRHILTAAHVVEDMPAGTIDVNADFTSGRESYSVANVILHPNWTSNWGYDLAILELETPMPVDGFSLYEGSNEIGQVSTLVGYGTKGSGVTGTISPDYDVGTIKRIGQNRWEALGTDIERAGFNPKGNAPDGSLLYSDFDNGLSANDALGYYLGINDLGLGSYEVNSTGGDSGGPRFLNVNGEWQVAGIVNGGMTTYASVDYTSGLDASYGELSFDTRVSYFTDWIYSVIGTNNNVSDDFSPDGIGTNGSLTIGGSQSGNLEIQGDTDWFRVTLTADREYRFSLDGNFDTYLNIYNSSGTLVAENDDGGSGLNSQLVYTASSTGDYYAVASAYDDASTGSFAISVNDISPSAPTDPLPPTTPSDIDEYYIVQRGIVSRGAGNDSYIISGSTIDSNADVTITDSQGSNILQFIDGLGVQGSMVTNDALQLQLNNSTNVTVLGASDFIYEVGGNPLTATPGTEMTFNQFVIQELGIISGVPETGIASGDDVIISSSSFKLIGEASIPEIGLIG